MSNNEKKAASYEDDEIDLLELLNTLLGGKWLILFFTVIACVLAFIFAYGQTSVYRADALLQVEEKTATVPGFAELAGLTAGSDSSVQTEIELLKSRKVLGKVVDRLKLDIVAEPQRVRYLGEFYHKFFNSDGGIEKPPKVWAKIDSMLSSYAWGEESIKVRSLYVPEELLGVPLTLVVTEVGYELFNQDVLLVSGVVNKTSVSKKSKVRIYVEELTGLPGTHYSIIKNSQLNTISTIKKSLKISEKGKGTGIIHLQMDSGDKAQMVKVLNRISNVYLAINMAYNKEEASKALEFLEGQIEPIKDRLAVAESELSQYRTRNQTANMSMETMGVLEVVATIDTELQQLEMQRASLSQRYTLNHPRVKVLLSQEAKLKERKKTILSKITRLPQKQQDLLKLERDFKVADAIYSKILNDIQEFKIAKASTIGNIHIVDTAVAHDDVVKPKRLLIITLGALLGAMLGTVLVFIRSAMNKAIGDPKVLEEHINIPIFATIPLNKKLNKLVVKGKRGRKQKTLLAIQDGSSPAIESLRSLRTSLQFTLFEAKNNIVMITGPSPSIGKSFISSNFAAVLAASDKRVLLIDADMRKGYLHEVLEKPRTPGLSELISGECAIEQAVHSVDIDDSSKLDAIVSGIVPPNPSELLMNSQFPALLEELSSRYDLILIDTPPVNAVTDPSIIGVHVGVVFMVVHDNHHTLDEIEHTLTRLSHTGITVNGFIYNGYTPKRTKYGYGYDTYSYGGYY